MHVEKQFDVRCDRDTVVELVASDDMLVALFPPTDSEAIAECNEYDTRVARVRCRVGVRVWYRDLADLEQALRLAHRS